MVRPSLAALAVALAASATSSCSYVAAFTAAPLVTSRVAAPAAKTDNPTLSMTSTDDDSDTSAAVTRRSAVGRAASAFLSVAAAASSSAIVAPAPPALARLDPVDRPDLLPKEPNQNVIQIEKFLTTGQAKRMSDMLTALERDTGYRVRVLCQAYPNTPGLAVRDYWSLGKEGQKDDKYIVLVVDQFGGKGNVLNFNVGEGVKFALPNVFWTRLQGKYGSTFFVKENGIDIAITNAIEAITTCLRSEDQYCVNVPDQGVSLRSLGM